jgi:hypothetical protein
MLADRRVSPIGELPMGDHLYSFSASPTLSSSGSWLSWSWTPKALPRLAAIACRVQPEHADRAAIGGA